VFQILIYRRERVASGGELFAKSSAKIFGLWFYENYIFLGPW